MQGRFDSGTIYQVQQANDIVEVISEHMSLSRKGKEMVGLCPFHEDHRPSLYVNSAKQIFKCFACGAGGSVITFVQKQENLTFAQAVERLAKRAGITLKPARRVRGGDSEQSSRMDPNRLAEVNVWAAKYFQNNLFDSHKGRATREYLAQRKIALDIARKWRLGLAVNSSDDLLRVAKNKGISEQMLKAAGLVLVAGGQLRDRFINRLMFTITDVTARVLGFGGRTLDSASAKYINSPATILFDKSNLLYGLEQAREQIVSSAAAVVVEGYTDCIMAHSKGCANVVATLGTSFTSGQARILRRYTKKIVLIFDNDNAGIEAANRALEICITEHIDIKVAFVPEGKDPCDFLLTAGKSGFEHLVANAVEVFEFKWNRLLERFKRSDTFIDNKAATEEFLQTIAIAISTGNINVIDRGLIVNRLSGTIGLQSKKLEIELNKRIQRIRKKPRAVAGSGPEKAAGKTGVSVSENGLGQDMGNGLYAAAQREVLEVLLNEPSLFELVKNKITVEMFDVTILKQVATILFKTIDAHPESILKTVLAQAYSPELGNVIAELAQLGQEKGSFRFRLSDAADVMLRRARRKGREIEIHTLQGQKQYLQDLSKKTKAANPHNVGMV
ncbi:MAG: DNA primase [Sedimentisphaerales bacterium]|nr:DNA primase [Sedimentisphaerales bacterium]